jgi:formylglycine-generating enzyme required for sulfatase activity
MDDQHPALAGLRAMLAAGQIDQTQFDAMAAALQPSAAHAGQAGANVTVAHGEQATAVGAGGIKTGDNISGTVNTGTLIQLIAHGKQPGASAEVLRKAYLARLMQQCDQVSLMAGDPRADALRLSQIYTALLTTEQRIESEDLGRHEQRPYLSVVDQLNRTRKLALLGDPGGGKSSVVHILVLAMAGEALGLPHVNLQWLTAPIRRRADEKAPESQAWNHGALLPVRVVLRELAAELPADEAEIGANTLFSHLQRQLHAAGLDEFLPHLKTTLLETGGLILLDGLDEVPDALGRRSRIKRAIEQFAQTYQRCRYLATSRTYAYQQQDWKLQGFEEAQLLPFQPWQIETFVKGWYAQMAALQRLTPGEAEDRAERLKTAAVHNPRIRSLAERPLLLTLIAKLQTEKGGQLPERPEELYARAVDLLLDEWESSKPRGPAGEGGNPEPSLAEYLRVGRDRIRKVLDRLAFEVHRDQVELTGSANIESGQLVNALLDAAPDADLKPQRLAEYLSHRAGLLTEHGNGLYQFPHRTFQEYLAACHLTDDDFPEQLAALARQDPQRWREVVRLAAAKAGRGTTNSVWQLAETLCPDAVDGDPQDSDLPLVPDDAWGALLAGQALVESADLDRIAKRDAGKRKRIRDWQLAILRRPALPAVERALAGRSLDRLGDPRPEVMTIDGMQFCHVPAGPFWMGDDTDNHAKPMHQVDLPAFWIGRYPVTTAQWRQYVNESGTTPAGADSLTGDGNAPAVWIDWHESLAFCAWLGARWAAHLPEGWQVCLPSEAQWEKAARGGIALPRRSRIADIHGIGQDIACSAVENAAPQRTFPWGEAWDTDYANAEMEIGRRSAVGAYPAGRSALGAEELVGNVWEWTRSLWGENFMRSDFAYAYPDTLPQRGDISADVKILRIVRGGDWTDLRSVARCAFRIGALPDVHSNLLGFRVVLCCPPVRSLRGRAF